MFPINKLVLVIYNESDKQLAATGFIIAEDSGFIQLQCDKNTLFIAKSAIIKVKLKGDGL
jgi:hypothetical protein